MRRKPTGTSLAEMVVASGLFSVFMAISVGLFSSMTRIVDREQKPAEKIMEARVAVLKVARRLRNCSAFVQPQYWQVITNPTNQLLMRDSVFRRTVEFKLKNGLLTETYFPIDYDPNSGHAVKPIKARRLCPAQSFQISSGGLRYPTRLLVKIVTRDGIEVRATTNIREAI